MREEKIDDGSTQIIFEAHQHSSPPPEEVRVLEQLSSQPIPVCIKIDTFLTLLLYATDGVTHAKIDTNII